MRKLLLSLVALSVAAVGCTPKTVISKSYDFTKMQRIGILSFTNSAYSLQGVENLFAKYLIQDGFKVVERGQLEQVLKEHNISVSGYLSPQTTKVIGQLLGVDALLIGEISTYTPTRTELALTSTRKTESQPVYQQELMQLPDGTLVGYTRNIGTSYSQTNEVRPTEYTINAKVGIIAKLVDVETAEIIWIGSLDVSSSSALEGADYIAKKLVQSFAKELNALYKK